MGHVQSLTDLPDIRALDVSIFGRNAMAEAEDDWLRPEMVYRAVGGIWSEYQELEPELRGLTPKQMSDIGCGCAIFDLLVARCLGADLLPIDTETNDRHPFGFSIQGAVYSFLAAAQSETPVKFGRLTNQPTRNKARRATLRKRAA